MIMIHREPVGFPQSSVWFSLINHNRINSWKETPYYKIVWYKSRVQVHYEILLQISESCNTLSNVKSQIVTELNTVICATAVILLLILITFNFLKHQTINSCLYASSAYLSLAVVRRRKKVSTWNGLHSWGRTFWYKILQIWSRIDSSIS